MVRAVVVNPHIIDALSVSLLIYPSQPRMRVFHPRQLLFFLMVSSSLPPSYPDSDCESSRCDDTGFFLSVVLFVLSLVGELTWVLDSHEEDLEMNPPQALSLSFFRCWNPGQIEFPFEKGQGLSQI